jgi:Cu/Ag efflux pump CusA
VVLQARGRANGICEGVIDRLDVISKNILILAFVILYPCFKMADNILGMLIVKVLPAVQGVILEGLRRLCISVTEIIRFSALEGSTEGRHHPVAGEELVRLTPA